MTKTGYADVNGARLYYEEEGSGPALVFVHAGIANLRMWDDQIPAFAGRYRVVRYDARGFGRSPMPDAPFSLSEDLFGLMRHLDIQRAVFVGCSMGGSTIVDFALSHPDSVRALVTVGAGVSGFPPSEDEVGLWQPIEAAFKAGDLDQAVELTVRLWVDGPGRTPEQVNPTVRARVREMERQNLAAPEPEHATPIELDPPAFGRLGEIAAPTLVLVGDQDVPSIQRTADALASGIPGARKVVLHDTAHVPSMEQPDEFNRLVGDFLASLPSA